MAYQVTFGYNDVVAFRNALKIQKAIFEVQYSSYELEKNEEYKRCVEALAKVEEHL